MEPIDTFHTNRLTAERLRDAHLAELCLITQNPQVMATLSADGGILTTEETEDRLNKGLQHWERHGFGLWAFHEKLENRFVGLCQGQRIFNSCYREIYVHLTHKNVSTEFLY
jgi:RimJ/RimL family protein N-acetyltransferase